MSNIKIRRCLDSKRRPLVSSASALTNDPQPLLKTWFLNSFLFQRIQSFAMFEWKRWCPRLSISREMLRITLQSFFICSSFIPSHINCDGTKRASLFQLAGMHQSQCDQIWQNFPTWANIYEYFASIWQIFDILFLI